MFSVRPNVKKNATFYQKRIYPQILLHNEMNVSRIFLLHPERDGHYKGKVLFLACLTHLVMEPFLASANDSDLV